MLVSAHFTSFKIIIPSVENYYATVKAPATSYRFDATSIRYKDSLWISILLLLII